MTQISTANARLEEMTECLVERGLTITWARARMLEVLASSDTHPDAYELQTEVRLEYPSTCLATVYNMFSVLKECGRSSSWRSLDPPVATMAVAPIPIRV